MHRIAIFIFILFALSACTNHRVSTNAEVWEKADFQEFKTWRWHEWAQDDSVNEILHDQVKSTVARELTKKGLNFQPESEVDFLVNYVMNVRNDIEIDRIPTYEGFSERYIGIDRYGRHINVTEFQLRKQLDESETMKMIVKGTLIIDILDPQTKKILLRLIAEKPMPSNAPNAETRQRRLDAVVVKLLSKFPPQP